MIRRIRRRFILIATCSVMLVLTILMTAINAYNYHNIVRNADVLLEMLAEGGGRFPGDFRPNEMAGKGAPFENGQLPSDGMIPSETVPALPDGETFAPGETPPALRDGEIFAAGETPPALPDGEIFASDASQGSYTGNSRGSGYGNRAFGNFLEITEETPYETRFFSVLLAEDGTLLSADTGSIAAIDETKAAEMAAEVQGRTKNAFYDSYRYSVSDTDSGDLVIFVDCSRSLGTFRTFLFASILISLIGTFCVFLLIVAFSSVILRPISESYEKQKRFITDASHEIKTPLTIIDANTEILEMDKGEDEWTQSIHRQVSRLRELTNHLVALSRMEEENRQVPRVDFSLTDAVAESTEPFAASAAAAGITLRTRIEEGITLNGVESEIRQLVSILLDNAVKYTPEGGSIQISLQRKGRQSLLQVENTAPDMKEGDHDDLFGRFTRADSSRNSSTGGFGIGLSMAHAIVEEHKGRIKALSPEDGIFRITATL